MTDTDADYALEEIFRRDEALKGGAGKPPKHPEESAKKPEAVKKAED